VAGTSQRRRRIHPAVATAKARVGSLAAAGASPEKLAEARAELEAAKTDAAIDALIAKAPPLTAEQRARLAARLGAG
jgi:hypothetical protein